MQLKSFKVEGLFGHYTHSAAFPTIPENSTEPSIVILCGPNGVGKTRILQMIEGVLKLDFTAFREVPFSSAELKFSDNTIILVKPINRYEKKESRCLEISFKRLKVYLKIKGVGPHEDQDDISVENFREKFRDFVKGMSVHLISTARLQHLNEERKKIKEEQSRSEEGYVFEYMEQIELPAGLKRAPRQRPNYVLAGKVKEFITEAQLNTNRFFSPSGPDLLSWIYESLTNSVSLNIGTVSDLEKRFLVLKEKEDNAMRYGLRIEVSDFDKLERLLNQKQIGKRADQALIVIQTYLEFLESRVSDRELLIFRIKTFEQTVNSFFKNKTISVNAKDGIIIKTNSGDIISEYALSSGEYHLLFLCATAFMTKRRGSVIAIDEPELSMHLEWQRRLIPELLKCASSAQPQFIVATHSPDITSSYSESCIELGV